MDHDGNVRSCIRRHRALTPGGRNDSTGGRRLVSIDHPIVFDGYRGRDRCQRRRRRGAAVPRILHRDASLATKANPTTDAPHCSFRALGAGRLSEVPVRGHRSSRTTSRPPYVPVSSVPGRRGRSDRTRPNCDSVPTPIELECHMLGTRPQTQPPVHLPGTVVGPWSCFLRLIPDPVRAAG